VFVNLGRLFLRAQFMFEGKKGLRRLASDDIDACVNIAFEPSPSNQKTFLETPKTY
jgi:hypothetical protein